MTKKKRAKPAKKSASKAQPPAPTLPPGPARHGVKSWQSGKPHLTPAQLAGKSRKVH